MRARSTLLAAATAVLSLVAASERASAQNVVVIVMDDVGPGLIGACDAQLQAAGAPSGIPANTPAIDQLMAARGITFTRAWSCPVCSPSRASMLTGRNGSRTGIGTVVRPRGSPVNVGLDPQATLLPQVLHGAAPAYACAAVGKWHLADPVQLRTALDCPLGIPAGRWFDRYAGSLYSLVRESGVPENQTGYFVWDKLYASPIDSAVAPCAPDLPPCYVVRSAANAGGYATVDTADDALTLLQQLPEPFFLYVAFNAVHIPAHDVPPGLPTGACGTYVPPAVPCNPGSPATKAARVRCMMESLDTQIARVLCATDENDTTVILVGDNGTAGPVVLPPYTAAHAKSSVYEGGVHVPMIVRSPRIAPNRRGTQCDALVGLVDVFATTCELAGLNPSATPGVDSVSLVPYLDGATASQRVLQYTELFAPNFTPDPQFGGPPAGYLCNRHQQALRDARFKLIRRWKRGSAPGQALLTEELYDSVAGGPPIPNTTPPVPTPDFLESNNLLAAGAPPLSARAAAALANLRAELDAHYPTLVH